MIYTNKLTDWVVSPADSGWVCGRIDEDGNATTYRFLTQEWAELCRRSMQRFDQFEQQRKWGVSLTAISHPHQMCATASLRNMMTFTRFDLENKPILVIDHNRDVIKLDVPAIIYLWLKTTWIPKAWKRLMWGEKGKQ